MGRKAKTEYELEENNNLVDYSEISASDHEVLKDMKTIMDFGNLPAVNLHEPERVKDRIAYYFDACYQRNFKPTISSLAVCLGMSRSTLVRVCQNADGETWRHLPTLTKLYVKKAYELIGSMMENWMTEGKINPVSAIFLSKNNLGYVDKVEFHSTIENENDISDSDVIQRYFDKDFIDD